MAILPQGTHSHPVPDLDIRETRLAVAIELLTAHRTNREETLARIDRSERHLIAASWDAGVTIERIAEVLHCSITPIRARLQDADREGKLRRPLTSRRRDDGVPDSIAELVTGAARTEG